MSAANTLLYTYKVGEFVYVESQANHPYLIRRIEELNKTPGGSVEAKVACFYRKRDISNNLTSLSDKHGRNMEEEMEVKLTAHERYLLSHKEIFLSRGVDNLPANHIRGKCSVTLFNETEDIKSYLMKDDAFYYTLVYDPGQKTLVADRGEIRVGSRYQAEVPVDLVKNSVEEEYKSLDCETLVWDPHNNLEEELIDSFLTLSKSVGTFARALDSTGSLQPSVHVNAACASRDTTQMKALDLLHSKDYNFSEACKILTSKDKGPMLVRDEMEHWSPSEATLFEDALAKYGKNFHEMKVMALQWKTVPAIVEYYYMYKTSERYCPIRRTKATEAEAKLKQIYIPPYKMGSNAMKSMNGDGGSTPCAGCHCTQSYQWYNWGPNSVTSRRLCAICWDYWKKYGGLQNMQPSSSRRENAAYRYNNGPDKLDRSSTVGVGESGIVVDENGGGGSLAARGKAKQAFFFEATQFTRITRRVCHDMWKPRHFHRKPFSSLIAAAAVKAECQVRLKKRPLKTKVGHKKTFSSITVVLEKISGRVDDGSNKFRTKPKLPNGQGKTNQTKAPAAAAALVPPTVGRSTSLKRPHSNGTAGITATINSGSNGGIAMGVGNSNVARNSQNGPPRKRRNVNMSEVSEDYVFVINNNIRNIRRQISNTNQRSVARRPHQMILNLPMEVQAMLTSFMARASVPSANNNSASVATTPASVMATPLQNIVVNSPILPVPASSNEQPTIATVRSSQPVSEPIVIDD